MDMKEGKKIDSASGGRDEAGSLGLLRMSVVSLSSSDSHPYFRSTPLHVYRPTSSPFITSVGGSTGSPESVWSDGGGGFSNTYGTPSYQADAVKAYLNSGVAPQTSFFNASGRAYPDVAAFATGFEIVMHQTTIGVDGTSCATPTFAGVVSALNDVRMAAGKPTLGESKALYEPRVKCWQVYHAT